MSNDICRAFLPLPAPSFSFDRRFEQIVLTFSLSVPISQFLSDEGEGEDEDAIIVVVAVLF